MGTALLLGLYLATTAATLVFRIILGLLPPPAEAQPKVGPNGELLLQHRTVYRLYSTLLPICLAAAALLSGLTPIQSYVDIPQPKVIGAVLGAISLLAVPSAFHVWGRIVVQGDVVSWRPLWGRHTTAILSNITRIDYSRRRGSLLLQSHGERIVAVSTELCGFTVFVGFLKQRLATHGDSWIRQIPEFLRGKADAA